MRCPSSNPTLPSRSALVRSARDYETPARATCEAPRPEWTGVHVLAWPVACPGHARILICMSDEDLEGELVDTEGAQRTVSWLRCLVSLRDGALGSDELP